MSRNAIEDLDHEAFFEALIDLGTIAQASAKAGMPNNRLAHAIKHIESNPPECLSSQRWVDALVRRRAFAAESYRMLAEHWQRRAERIEAMPPPTIVPASFVSKQVREELQAKDAEIAALRARVAAADAPEEAGQGGDTDRSAENPPQAPTGAQKAKRRTRSSWDRPENPNSERFGKEIDAQVETWQPGDRVPPGFLEIGNELVDIR